MRVFKTCFTITKRNFVAFALYFIIFLALSIVMTSFSSSQQSMDFETVKPNITLVNRDLPSPLLDGLRSYLSAQGNEIIIPDTLQELQDATYYQTSDYIVIIPEGFTAAFEQGRLLPLETVTATDSARGYYANMLTEQYLSLAQAYTLSNTGYTQSEIADLVLHDLAHTADVELLQFSEAAPVDEGFSVFYRTFGYIIIVLITVCVSNVFLTFQRPELLMRNLCSPLPARKMNGQLSLYALTIGTISWLLLVSVSFLIYGTRISGSDPRIIALILLNSFIFMLVALSISMVVRLFIRDLNTQNMVANFLSLGLCFLGGVFVPIELFGEELIHLSRLLPTYWYTTSLTKICALTDFHSGTLLPIWQGLFIQLLFAVAIAAVALLLQRSFGQSERNFTPARTELDT